MMPATGRLGGRLVVASDSVNASTGIDGVYETVANNRSQSAVERGILEYVRQVLRLPAFRHLLAAYALNQLAWSMASVSLAFLVYHQTGSAAGATAFFLCSQFVPGLLSPSLVARLDQRAVRWVLASLYALEAVAYAALALVASNFSLGLLLAIVLVDGVLAVTARALTRAATVAVTSPAGLLREGNALFNATFSICFLVGPALGGAIVVVGGPSAALVAIAGVFVVIALTLVSAADLPGPAHQPRPTAGRLRAALDHAWRRPPIRTLLGLQAIALLFFTMSIPVEIVLVQRSLHKGAAGYGALLSAWGAGAVAGSLIYTRWRGVAPRKLIAFGAGVLGIGFLIMAAAPTLAVALAGGALGGIGNGVEAVAMRTTLQEQVETDWMAMIMSLNESMFQLAPGPGIVIGGAITALVGPRAALGLAGAGALLVTGIVWVVLRPVAPDRPLPSPDLDETSGRVPLPTARR
jgi:MFS family permease